MRDIPIAAKATNDTDPGDERWKAGPRMRTVLLVAAAVRAVVALVAIPLVPFLFANHFVVLVAMRPTKEVLLAAGFLSRIGDVWLPSVVVAALPLSIFGVWLMYFIGRSYCDQLTEGKIPSWARRLVPPERVKKLRRLLDRKGARLILIGRMAAFPSTLLAAAAGSAGMDPRTFLAMDALGGGLSIAVTLALGLLLGEAYDEAGPWLTASGAVLLVVIAVMVARWIRRGVDD